jgi:hypothetical protein
MGFFAWLREGVRRAVLLGFSDAFAQLGHRSEHDDLGPQLAATLQQAALASPAGAPVASIGANTGRKRLGKSLAEIREANQS